MKIDFHVHSKYSKDCLTSLKTINKICKIKRIVPCITDHNSIKGALRYKKRYKECIIGEEIKTKEGEIIGLFLNEEVKRNLSFIETYEKIKEQGALVMLPHPFDRLRKRIKNIKKKPDIVEVFNSRVVFKEDNKKAEEYAKRERLLMAVGSDAHFWFTIGRAYVIIPDFDLDNPNEMLKKLRKAVFVKRSSPLFIHPLTKIIKIANLFFSF